MSKMVLFFIHGMGDQGDGWEESAVESLRKSRKALIGDESFENAYKVVPINYQTFFTNYWNQFNSRAEGLQQISLGGATPQILRKIVNIARTAVDDSNPWVSHWGDVGLYLGTEIGYAIQSFVWDRIIQELSARQIIPKFGIIAHSLGTRVAHDVLQRAYSDDSGRTIRLFGKPRLLALISNIIRLSSFSESHLTGGLVVYPSPAMDKGACYRYANIWHPLDPIARLRQFRIERYPILSSSKVIYPLQSKATDVVESVKQIHSLHHYLAIPEVAQVIINGMEWLDTSDFGPVDDLSVAEYRRDYERNTILGNWRKKLEEIEDLDLDEIDSWSDIVNILESV